MKQPLSFISVLLLASVAAHAQQTPQPNNTELYQQRQAERVKLPKFEREKTVFSIAEADWDGQRTADGQPDVQGQWSNTISNHNNLTDPQGPLPGEKARRATERSERAPSRIIDPADGQIPLQPWARSLQQEFINNFHDPVKPEYVEPLARCAPAGPSKSFMWHGYEIRQYPGYVLFLFDSGSRLIHLNDKPALPEQIKLWNGDSRGHWQGNTLHVEVRNNNSKARFGRSGEFTGPDTIVREKFIFDKDSQRLLYQATYEDPKVLTRPFTLQIPSRRVEHFQEDGWNNQLGIATSNEYLLEPYEQICHENNGGFGGGAVIGAANPGSH